MWVAERQETAGVVAGRCVGAAQGYKSDRPALVKSAKAWRNHAATASAGAGAATGSGMAEEWCSAIFHTPSILR